MRTTAYTNNRRFAMVRTIALTSATVAEGIKRLTIEVPEDLHDAFQRKCFLARPRVTMRERIIDFIAKETGQPIPKLVDRRKLTRAEREKLQQSPKPRGRKG